MQKIIYIDFDLLETKYLNNFSIWKVEESILDSLSKKDFEIIINDTQNSYMALSVPYNYFLYRKITKLGGKHLSKIEKYFIEMQDFYFNGGCEIKKTREFLDRLKGFYKGKFFQSQYIFQNYKKFDINSVSIIEVLSRYIKIPNSFNRNIKCMIHKDKTASFRLYKNTNSFYCFGCHKGGNSVVLVSEIENISRKDAFIKLAKLYS